MNSAGRALFASIPPTFPAAMITTSGFVEAEWSLHLCLTAVAEVFES